jgi:two-component system, response regulator PdtaR
LCLFRSIADSGPAVYRELTQVLGVGWRMADKQSQTVLVVDDEPLVLLNAAEMIEQAGWQALEASNSAEALAVLAQHPRVDVLFTDIHMPGEMNGLELAALVHQCHPQIHLVITSGKGFLADYVLPANGTFMPKPYTYDQLLHVLAGKIGTV